MDFSLDDEQKLVVSTIRRFVEKDIREWAPEADREGAPPSKLLHVGGDVGFLVDAVPAEHDGFLEGDYSHETRALRGIELGRGCVGMAAILEGNVEPALAVGRWGSDAAKSALFGSLGDGGVATLYSDFYRTLQIELSDAGAKVSGKTGAIPGLGGASHVLVCGRAGDEQVLLLLATDAASVDELVPSGWRSARWGTLTCDAVSVASDMVIACGNEAADAIAELLAWHRVSLAARAVGVCQAATEYAEAYAAERIQFGQPIGAFESLARMRDRAETATAAARALCLEAAWKIDAGTVNRHDAASRARDFANDVIARTTIDCVQIYGGYGFVNDYPVEKLMRDARPFEVLLGNEALDRVLVRRHDAA